MNITSFCNGCKKLDAMRFFNNNGHITKTCFHCDKEEFVCFDHGYLFNAMRKAVQTENEVLAQ